MVGCEERKTQLLIEDFKKELEIIEKSEYFKIFLLNLPKFLGLAAAVRRKIMRYNK
jgi:hypothetical protein